MKIIITTKTRSARSSEHFVSDAFVFFVVNNQLRRVCNPDKYLKCLTTLALDQDEHTGEQRVDDAVFQLGTEHQRNELLLRFFLLFGRILFDGLDALDHAFHHLLFLLRALLDRLFGRLFVCRLILFVAASR
jgi:hypothetical protein